MTKMQGFLPQIGREADETATWQMALGVVAGRIDAAPPEVPTSAMAALEAHWEAAVKALTTRNFSPAATLMVELARPDRYDVGPPVCLASGNRARLEGGWLKVVMQRPSNPLPV
jgi:hypothetical protein